MGTTRGEVLEAFTALQTAARNRLEAQAWKTEAYQTYSAADEAWDQAERAYCAAVRKIHELAEAP